MCVGDNCLAVCCCMTLRRLCKLGAVRWWRRRAEGGRGGGGDTDLCRMVVVGCMVVAASPDVYGGGGWSYGGRGEPGWLAVVPGCVWCMVVVAGGGR